MIDKTHALVSLRPGAEWVLRGDELEWMDAEQTQPTDAEINAEVARLQALEPTRIVEASRQAAYVAEADPLFFKWQAGESTQAEWQAKREEIRQRFPKETE